MRLENMKLVSAALTNILSGRLSKLVMRDLGCPLPQPLLSLATHAHVCMYTHMLMSAPPRL